MKRLILALLLLFLSSLATAQQWSGIISSSRAADWTQIGAGAIPINRTQCGSTIAAYGSSGSPASPSAISTAINGCAPETYVQLGTGTFYLSGSFSIANSNVSLRGNGPENTILSFSSAATCGEAHPAAICVAGGDDGTDGSGPANIASRVSGYTQGATSITMTQTTGSHQPVVGQVIEMQMQTDGTSPSQDTWPNVFTCLTASSCTQSGSGGAPDGSPAPWGGPFELFKITSISGTCTASCTVGISPPVHMPNWGVKPVRVWWQNETAVTGVGLEAFQVTGASPPVGFRWATTSWMKNVEINGSRASGAPHYILLNKTVGITIRDSYLFGQGNWSDEYAVDCYSCGATLFENNLIEFIRTGFTQEMGEGNVISYNYEIDNAAVVNTGNEEGLENNHGCCSSYMLLEGNDGVNVLFDNYFGQSQFTTEFRNRLWGKTSLDNIANNGALMPVLFNNFDRFNNLIGNVLGRVGFHSSYQTVGGDGITSCATGSLSIFNIGKGLSGCATSIPDDLHAAASTMRWGNWDVVTNAVRWCGNASNPGWSTTCASTSEVPTGLTDYANTMPSSLTLPASFLYTSQPGWWGVPGQAAIPWPAIGPDVTGGNLANSGGFANKIPARVCFESVMGGSFSDSTPKTFDANLCYIHPSSSPQK